MKKETILITGGTGFLGSRLARRLMEEGCDVLVAKRSFSSTMRLEPFPTGLRFFDLDKTDLGTVFSREKIAMVLHCATDYGRKPVPASSVIEANLVLPLKLLELAAEHGSRTFLNTDTILDKGVNHYSLSKKQFSDWLATFSSEITGINVALEHFFGPGDDLTKFVSHMTDEIVREVASIDLSPGRQTRDFIYIDDVIEAFIVLIQRSRDLGRGYFKYEVGSGRKISIQDFMVLLKRLARNNKTDLRFGAIPYRDNEIMDSNVDLRALTALGWSPRVPLDDGLTRTIAAARARTGMAAKPPGTEV